MFEVTKNEDCICVTVKLEKRVKTKDPKVYVYTNDALQEAKKKFPHTKMSEKPEQFLVASNVRGPQEVTWKFKILETKTEVSKPQEQKKDLTSSFRRAKTEKPLEVESEEESVQTEN